MSTSSTQKKESHSREQQQDFSSKQDTSTPPNKTTETQKPQEIESSQPQCQEGNDNHNVNFKKNPVKRERQQQLKLTNIFPTLKSPYSSSSSYSTPSLLATPSPSSSRSSELLPSSQFSPNTLRPSFQGLSPGGSVGSVPHSCFLPLADNFKLKKETTSNISPINNTGAGYNNKNDYDKSNPHLGNSKNMYNTGITSLLTSPPNIHPAHGYKLPSTSTIVQPTPTSKFHNCHPSTPYSRIVDQQGRLYFTGKVCLHPQGVDFIKEDDNQSPATCTSFLPLGNQSINLVERQQKDGYSIQESILKTGPLDELREENDIAHEDETKQRHSPISSTIKHLSSQLKEEQQSSASREQTKPTISSSHPKIMQSYKLNINEFKSLDILGQGQYGVVHRALHAPTNQMMAMKEIRLELDENNLKQILMELDILHKSHSPYIVDFYGAFFIESCVYYCMEYMDVGSMDLVYQVEPIQESILGRIAFSMTSGLLFLKEELSIIHRDVKPTNVLLNSKGQVKLCDFGVSGQLKQSLAKTNIGCQSYMAPERIAYSQEPIPYTVQSDVWSFGLSLLEMALGYYPFPTSEYDSVFAQLSAIITGNFPSLPSSRFSNLCQDFTFGCLKKNPKDRPTYAQLLNHPWMKWQANQELNMIDWAQHVLTKKPEFQMRHHHRHGQNAMM